MHTTTPMRNSLREHGIQFCESNYSTFDHGGNSIRRRFVVWKILLYRTLNCPPSNFIETSKKGVNIMIRYLNYLHHYHAHLIALI